MKEFYNDYLDKNHKFDRWTMVGILALLIVITGCFGWLYEFIFYLIYYLTYKHRKKPWKVFLISFLLTGILEYFSGLGMLLITHKRCWDYNQEILNFGNIGGFVCLRSVMFFGLSALLLMYVIIPFLFFLAKKLNKKVFLTISITLCSIILFDEFYNLLFARILNLPRAYDVYSKLGIPYVKFK